MSAEDLTHVRIAENQSTFRAANEKIEATAEELGIEGETPFICECPDRRCFEIVRVSLETYVDVRRHPRRFFNAPGHEAISVENGAGTVVAEHDDYVVVEKVGLAGELAAEKFEEVTE